jgi:outer membrane protein TolC
LDVRISAHQLNVAAKAQGLGDVTSFTDIEWGIRRTSTTERGDGGIATSSGNEISIKLPLFDWGDLQRSRMAAQTLGAINAYEAAALMASSEVREAYSAYRTAFDIAQHYQQEIIPLRQRMSEENQYRYNGMMIGTLELLADARMQVGVVQSALKATEQFWLAEAALGESLISSPTAGFMLSGATASAASAGGH